MSGNTLRLDEDSTSLLRSILAHGPEESARAVAREFEVDEDEVRRDVADFIRDLP